MKKYIEQNPFLSVIVAAGVAVGAMMSISTGFEKLDRIVCTEAEAEEMIQRQTVPMHRDEIEFQMKQLKYQIYILEQKEINNKAEPWEGKLLEDLEQDLEALQEKKSKLPR